MSKDSEYYERRIKRLQKKIDTGTELRHQQQTAVSKYKDQLKGMLEAQIRIARLAGEEVARLKEVTVSNAMTIRELNDQLAVQWKQRAEAVSDVKQAQELAARAATNNNRLVQQVADLKRDLQRAADVQAATVVELAEARLSIQYRLWYGFQELVHQVWVPVRRLARQGA